MPSSSSGVKSRWPRTASSRRHGALERAVELTREDDVDDVLRPEAPLRRDRLDDRDRAFDRQLVSLPDEARLLRELALQGVDQASRRSGRRLREAASARARASRAGSGGSTRASGGAPTPGSAARGACASCSPRSRGPSAPRSLSGQLVDLDELDPRQLHDDELGDPHPRLDDERHPSRSVLWRITLISPR